MSAAAETLEDMLQSGGRPSELNSDQRRYLRDYFQDSLYAFCAVVMSYTDLDPELHGELCTYIELLGSPDHDRLMSQLPRGHLKSSIGTIAHAAWRILRKPDWPVGIINQNTSNTSNWLRAIKSVFEQSDWVYELWPEILPRGVYRGDPRSRAHSLKWSDSELELEGRRIGEPESSISGYGRSSGHTGHHWPILILDDLIGPDERASTAEMEQAFVFARSYTPLMRPAESGWAYVNCTPWTFSDIYVFMLQEQDYKLYRRAALEKPGRIASLSGQPIFPKLFNRERLLKLYHGSKRKGGVAHFLAQYMCSPIAGEDQAFDTESIRWFRVHRNSEGEPTTLEIEPASHRLRSSELVNGGSPDALPPRLVRLSQLNVAIFFDPAPAEGPDKKKEPNARNGLFVEGIDCWGRRYVLEAEGLLDRPIDVIHRIFFLARKWGASKLYVEEVVFSVLYRHWILHLREPGKVYQDRHLVPIPVEPGRTNKDTRIRDKINGWDDGRYYVNRDGTTDFYEEFSQYPHSQTRDILDAMAYDGVLTRPPTDEEEMLAALGQQTRLRAGMDRLTGYLWPFFLGVATCLSSLT